MPTKFKVFIDTNIFVALKDKNDSTHTKAVRLTDYLGRQKTELFTSSDVVGETLTVMSRKLGKQTSLAFLKEYKLSSGIKEIFIEEALHEKARELFAKISSPKISFIDCSSAVAMRSEGISIIFSFDRDFKSLGVTLLEEIV